MTRGPLIVKIGGLALEPGEAPAGLFRSLAALHAAEPGGVVIVHGGARATDALLGAAGHGVQRVEGLRVTRDDQIDLVAASLAGLVNKRLVASLVGAGARAIGLSLLDAGLCRVEAHARADELGRVGVVAGGDGAPLRDLLGAGFLPAIASIGAGADGGFLNVNADDAAAGLAEVAGARAVLFLTDTPGVLDASGAVIGAATPAETESLIASGVIAGGMVPKTRAALACARRAGVSAIIASWRDPGALARIASGEPAGTTLLPDRPAAPAGATDR